MYFVFRISVSDFDIFACTEGIDLVRGTNIKFSVLYRSFQYKYITLNLKLKTLTNTNFFIKKHFALLRNSYGTHFAARKSIPAPCNIALRKSFKQHVMDIVTKN